MRQVGSDSFEISNKSTGEIRVVSGGELQKYGLSRPSKWQDWVPAVTGTIGAVTGSILGPVGTGAGAAVGTGAGYAIKDILSPKYKDEYTGKTKAGFAELSDIGKKKSAETLKQSVVDSAVSGATSYAGAKIIPAVSKYVGNIAKAEGIVGKAKQLIPSTNIATTGSKIATKGATKSTSLFAKNQFLNEVVSAAKESSDPSVTTAVKKILTNGLDKKTVQMVNNASIDELSDLVLKNPNISKNVPTNMLEALLKRRAVGEMKSWPTFIQNIIGQSAEPGKSKAAEIMYRALNTQLKTIPDVKKGDAIVKMAKVLGIPVESLVATSIGVPAIVSKVMGR